MEKTPRQDVVFIKKNGSLFHWHVHETLQMSNNKVDNFETVYTTMVLLFLELGADEIILDILRLALEIQVCVAVVSGLICLLVDLSFLLFSLLLADEIERPVVPKVTIIC